MNKIMPVVALTLLVSCAMGGEAVKPADAKLESEYSFDAKKIDLVKPISEGDGAFEQTTHLGKSCAKLSGNYLYVDIDNAWSSGWAGKEPAEIVVEYASSFAGKIAVEYDSNDPKNPNPSFKKAKEYTMAIGQWKLLTFPVADALFQKGGNGHDFRVVARPGTFITRVIVRYKKKQ